MNEFRLHLLRLISKSGMCHLRGSWIYRSMAERTGQGSRQRFGSHKKRSEETQ